MHRSVNFVLDAPTKTCLQCFDNCIRILISLRLTAQITGDSLQLKLLALIM